MSHLRLVPPLPAEDAADGTADCTEGTTGYHDPKVALLMFQADSGVCLFRACSRRRYPAYGSI